MTLETTTRNTCKRNEFVAPEKSEYRIRHITQCTNNTDETDKYISTQGENINDQELNELPFLNRLFGSLADFAKRLWKKIREYNPLTKFFNTLEQVRCFKHIENAKDRNGVKTEEELKEYHQSLKFDPENPDPKKLFRTNITKNNESKPLIVLCLGNVQTLSSSESFAGLNKLYKQLEKEGYDVIIFRTGDATYDLRHRFLLDDDCSLNTNVVFEHTSNIIEDIIKERGLFNGHKKPQKVIFTGYSFGGGTVDRLLNKKWSDIGQNIPVSTVYIDPIELGAYNLGIPVEKRPLHSIRHLNFYQENSAFINGINPEGLKNGDLSIGMSFDNHDSIDNNEKVLKTISNFIKNQLKAS